MQTILLERQANLALGKIDRFITQLEDARTSADSMIEKAETEKGRLNVVINKCNKVKKFVNALFSAAKI